MKNSIKKEVYAETNSKTNMEVIQEFYNALDKGDVPALINLFDPKIEWKAKA